MNRIMSNSWLKKIIVVLFLFGGSLPVLAQAEESFRERQKDKSPASLDEIIVTATRIEEPKKDVSSFIQIINREDIKNSTAKDAGDLLAEAAVGHLNKYNNTLTGRIQLRGLSTDLLSLLSSRVLILTNGSNAGTVNLAKISADDIERIEIVKGPASVLYGSSAMGGVINIITKEGKEGFQGSAGGEAGSWGYWKTKGELSGKTGAFDYFLTAGRSSQGNYSSADYGRIPNSSYKNEAVSVRAGYALFGSHHLSLGLQHWKGWDIGSPGPIYSLDPDNFTNKQRDGFDVNFKTETFKAKYYLVKDQDESHGGMTTGFGNSNISTTNIDTQGLNLQKTFLIGDHRIILGGQWDRIESSGTSNTGAPYYPNSKYDSYGVFSEGRLSLANKKMLLNAGLRYDYFQNEILPTSGIKNLIPKTENLDHLTARGGIVYKPIDLLSIKANVGTAFRAPAPLELTADYVSFGTHYVGNPNLKPEQSTTYDLGFDFSQSTFKGGFSFFHTNFKDKISSYYDSIRKVSTYRNTDGGTIEGLETNVSYDFGPFLGFNGSLMPFTHITYHTKYTDESQGGSTTLLYTPLWTGAFGIKAGQERWEARFIGTYRGTEKIQDWNPSSPTYGKNVDKGDFTVFSLKGVFRPVKNLELTASVENLFDRGYEYVLGYPMPGRTFMASIKGIF